MLAARAPAPRLAPRRSRPRRNPPPPPLAASRPAGGTSKDGPDGDAVIPQGVSWDLSEEDRASLESLKRRSRAIKQLKLQRSRISLGDYVSDEVTRFRGERFRVERALFDLRKDLDAHLKLERFAEAEALRVKIASAEMERDGISRAIVEAQERALRRYDEQM
jgi:hypothetical protein